VNYNSLNRLVAATIYQAKVLRRSDEFLGMNAGKVN